VRRTHSYLSWKKYPIALAFRKSLSFSSRLHKLFGFCYYTPEYSCVIFLFFPAFKTERITVFFSVWIFSSIPPGLRLRVASVVAFHGSESVFVFGY
jgi:hypothetical protein